MPSTTTRQEVRAAFKIILSDANLGVKIYDRMPYEGAEPRSVVLTIVSGSSSVPAVGSYAHLNIRSRQERYRLQVDCYHDDKAEADKLADKAEQAIMDNLAVLRSTYGIYDVKKVLDTDTLPPGQTQDAMLREARVLLDFEFYTHRAVS